MTLKARQRKAIPVLLGSNTLEAAAKKTGISRKTMYAWMEQKEFKQAVSEARNRLFDESMKVLTNSCMKAVLTLEALLNAQSEAVRRNAANDILGHVLKYRELTEFEERLETVEKIVLERKTYKS
jgi:hypothetical protein